MQQSTEPIRHAIGCDEFPKALKLWNAYAAEMLAAVRSGTACESELDEMRRLVEWSRSAARAARAHAADQIRHCNAARKYSEAPGPMPPIVRASL
jgi:hypothetical protein